VEVDIGCAKEVQEDITSELTSILKKNPNDYVRDSMDVKLTGITQQGLKATIFIMFKYNMPVDDFARKRKAAQNAVTAITDVIAKHHRRGAVSYSYHNKVELVGGQNIDPAAGGNPLMGMPGMI